MFDYVFFFVVVYNDFVEFVVFGEEEVIVVEINVVSRFCG